MDNAPPTEMKWLNVADLADLLRLKKRTIYNRLSAKPNTLPPATRVPKLRGPRWSVRVVKEWQAQYDPVSVAAAPTHRGRPTKTETIARRRLSEHLAREN
jgi:predicted DNA-binding transcriptional regulator AlpA